MKTVLIFLTALLLNGFVSAQSPKNLTLLDSIQYTGQSLSGCWHYNDSSGKEYALIGASHGIIIVDISNPTNTNTLFQLPGVESNWHEVKVNGDFAYAVSEGSDSAGIKNGLQIIDLRYLPDSAPNKFYQGDSIIAGQLIRAHSITTAGNFLYINGHSISSLGNGVLILNITDPLFPVYSGAITTRYCHDSYVRGDIIYTSDIGDGLFSVYDITNPSSPLLLATQTTPGQFNHNTWLSDNGNIIFTVDERMNTPLASYDISNLNNITLLDTFYNRNFSSFEVHNVRVKDDYLICPSYGSQLTIVDANRPGNLIEVGNYTTGNSLCWDADPYTASGNIIATDKNSGNGTFYLFGPVYQRACYLEGVVSDSISGLPIINAEVEILSISVLEYSDFLGEYQTGYADSGNYIVEFSKTGYTSRQLSVNLQNGILTTLNVKLLPVNTHTENFSSNKIEIYPNPVYNLLNVYSSEVKISKWIVSDKYGRVVKESEPSFSQNGEFSIDLNSFAAGMYSVEFVTDEGRLVKSIVKQ